jgi:hypothetical protein
MSRATFAKDALRSSAAANATTQAGMIEPMRIVPFKPRPDPFAEVRARIAIFKAAQEALNAALNSLEQQCRDIIESEREWLEGHREAAE